ncbi:hypothetical protein Tco_0033876 [Tanacetum coccineum]
MTLAASTSTDKSLKDFDELMSTPIDFSGYILNGLKIKNLTQEILLGPAFRLLKSTRSNYAELEYDFKECYKALSEKLDWENPEGGDYPFDLSKPLPLIKHGKRQRVPFEFFINNDLKYLQGGILTMTYTTSTTKTKAAKYDLPGIEDMVPNIWSPRHAIKRRCIFYKAYSGSHSCQGNKEHRYGYLEEIVVRRADNILYRFKEGDFLRLQINDIEDMLILVVQNQLINLSGDDVADFAIALGCSSEVWLFKSESRIFNLELKVIKRRSTSPSLILQDQILEKGTCTLHTKTLKDSFIVLAKEKMEHIEKEKNSFHDQGHQQAAKGKDDDEEFGEIRWFNTTAGNPVKKILLKLNLSDHRSILTDSKEHLKMVMERQSVKVKEIQERCIIKAFQDYQIKKGMSMSVQKSQVHEMEKFTRWRNEIMLG